MELSTAFDTFQREVNAEPEQLGEARRRRNLVKKAFGSESDVVERFPSGSLARGTMLEPIHDVDYVLVYDTATHPDWGEPGPSSAGALSHLGERINGLLGATNGTVANEVRLAAPRNHCVKCFFDDPEAELPFTVDVMPALRQPDGTLLIPEKRSEQWVPAHPEDLITRIAARHATWNRFVPLVRVLKHWNAKVACAGMKSLAVEVLAYQCIPQDFVTGISEHRPEALARFFTAAVVAIEQPICDPAGICGEIQPELDIDAVRAKLQQASDDAYLARAAEQRGDTDAAICQWRKVLGDQFPEPPGGCGKGLAAVPLVAPRLIRDTPQGT
jgi:hypothetical protein